MRRPSHARIAAPLLAVALAACADQSPIAGSPDGLPSRNRSASAGVEHASVVREGYTLRVYPGWARSVTTRNAEDGAVRELFRSEGAFRVPAGQSEPSTRHEIRLAGGAHGRDLAIGVEDPRHQIASIQLHLYGRGHVPGAGSRDPVVEVLDVVNGALTCPPACEVVVEPPALSMEPVALETGGEIPGLSEHRMFWGDGYELTVYPGFASRVVARVKGGEARTLYRQTASYDLPRGQREPAGQHLLRLRGGPFQRDLALRVHDPRHQIAAIVVGLYHPGHVPGSGSGGETVETLEITNTAQSCPPACEPTYKVGPV
jgi:hypothetical protein